MRLRDLYEEIEDSSATSSARVVPRVKARLSTSLCAGNRRACSLSRRVSTAYVYDGACYCSSPEEHTAQFVPGARHDHAGH
jgi:hypothetical protein